MQVQAAATSAVNRDNMPGVLVISPHLDDAAFSCAEPMLVLRRAGWQVDLATVFTASVSAPTGFALACQTDKGIDSDIDYMSIRRAEDKDFIQRLDFECHHLNLAEAPHRSYNSAAELFETAYTDDPAFEQCKHVLERLISVLQPDVCIGPLGVGRHVDHQVVVASLARALAVSGSDTRTVLAYAEQPYALKSPNDITTIVRTLETVSSLHFRSDSITRCQAIDAISAYATQLDYQFGGDAQMRRTLESALSEGTRLWHHGKAPGKLNPLLLPYFSLEQAH